MWRSLTKDWSAEEVNLLKQSWRKSTLDTYKAPIKRWLKWCEENHVDAGAPTANNFAKFLAYLHLKEKLVYNTISLHKSAISTFCSGGSSSNFSSNFLVQQVIKAVSIINPHEKKSIIWDAKILLDWLAVQPKKQMLFEISRRTASVLLLVSGRRIHDLTLLRTSKENFIDSNDEIILWPAFGSKTDRASFRQSGWKLSKNSNKWLCPVTMIRLYIKKSKQKKKSFKK